MSNDEHKPVGGVQELIPAGTANPLFSHLGLGQGPRMQKIVDDEVKGKLAPFDVSPDGVVSNAGNHRQAWDGNIRHQVRSNSAIAFRMLIWW